MKKIDLYQYQSDLAKAIASGKNIILQAPTGAGKTLASLYPFFEAWADDRIGFPKKCIYSVPMRVLANQFYDEYSKLLVEFNHPCRPTKARQTGEFRGDNEFKSNLIFATIDQVLSSWLMHPYSLSKRKGNINAGAMVGSYLIFDEFHLFDPDSTMPTTLHMLKTLKGISPFVLMTATFSADMLTELAEQLDAAPCLLTQDQLRDIANQDKTRTVNTVAQPLVTADGANVEKIIEHHLGQPADNQRSMVVCNQVARAQHVYQALVAHPALPKSAEVILLHSRFQKSDRQKIEADIRREFHKDNRTFDSVILVGTQTVEVGLDMSSPVLHTEIAPASSVLQRAGRCARYAGEVGRVFVYPVDDDNYAPYHKTEAKKQCLKTSDWLSQNQDLHIDFAAEQALINFAHGETDRAILDGLKTGKFSHKEDVERLWRGAGNSGDANRLIRNIQSVSVIVHDRPELFREAPFAAESFSLHPGTLKKQFKLWTEQNDELDPDLDTGYLDWIAQRLIEDEDHSDEQANRPIRFDFKPVTHTSQLQSPLIVLHPSLVSYTSKLGLVFDGDGMFKTTVPESKPADRREQYGYLLESYEEHVRLVYKAFEQDFSAELAETGRRLETRFGWPADSVIKMAKLVVALHDAGKLSTGWQGWAQQWQSSTAVNNPMPPSFAAAHTDFDPANNAQAKQNRQMCGKRPRHAVESAVVVLRVLALSGPTKNGDHPLVRAAFSAIARHHGPFSSEVQQFKLVNGFEAHIKRSFEQVGLAFDQSWQYDATINNATNAQKMIKKRYVIRGNCSADMLCYMLFARILRLSDQKGTKEGSK